MQWATIFHSSGYTNHVVGDLNRLGCSVGASWSLTENHKNNQQNQQLNALTRKCAYPLPHVDDCIERLAGKRYLTQLDFNSGFWKLRMDKSSKEMTAFRSEDGHFQFRRMPFGLVNAPASFQRLVNVFFSKLKWNDFQVFIDDICIASDTWKEHLVLIEQALTIVKSHGLTLKGDKCVYGASRVIFPGHENSST